MQSWKILIKLLLITLLALSASGVVSAKVASGLQNLGPGLHQGETAFNPLTHRAKIEFSTTLTPGSPVVTKETFQVGKSLGAAVKRISVQGGHKLAEGTKVVGIEKIASGRGIREVKRLVDQYGGKARNWIKKKGVGEVETSSGQIRKAELHWYEGHGVGKVDFKVKRWLD